MANTIEPLPNQRHLFDIPDDVAYLNCAYMSPLPKASIEAGDRGLRRKAQPWNVPAIDFFTGSEVVRELFARLINATSDDIALSPSRTEWPRQPTILHSKKGRPS